MSRREIDEQKRREEIHHERKGGNRKRERQKEGETEREDRGFGRSQQVDFSSIAKSLVSLLYL